MFDVIEYYESCIHLNLSNNRSIGVQGYQALTRYLRTTRYLERLDMNSTRFDDTSMLGFGRALRMSSTLYELHLESCQLNGKLLQRLIQNVRLCNCLRELYLCDNRMYRFKIISKLKTFHVFNIVSINQFLKYKIISYR